MVVVLLALKDKNTNHILWPANTYFVIVAVYMVIPIYWIILSKEIRLLRYLLKLLNFVYFRGKLWRSFSFPLPKRNNNKVSPK